MSDGIFLLPRTNIIFYAKKKKKYGVIGKEEGDITSWLKVNRLSKYEKKFVEEEICVDDLKLLDKDEDINKLIQQMELKKPLIRIIIL